MRKQLIKLTRTATNRVDTQVIAIVLLYTLLSMVITSQIYWNDSLNVLMSTHENRVLSLYSALETKLSPDSFHEINSYDDIHTALYHDTVDLMLDLKQATGVLYLYTAKVNENGEFIYLVDGLEEHLDYRYPGDPIEAEIIPRMERALHGEIVMPERILDTDWGKIFISYVPFHDKTGEILGVIGVEFDASNSFNTYTDLKTNSILICVGLIVSATLLTVYLFRRITNPLYLDKNTQDMPTGLKNRNAYEVDISNLVARQQAEGVGMVVIDVNGLKMVNDRLGHLAGDNYIELVAQAISSSLTEKMVGYRTGGDEFAVLVPHATQNELVKFIEICTSRIRSQKTFHDMRCSAACGYAIHTSTLDVTLKDTYERADKFMYEEKRRQKDCAER